MESAQQRFWPDAQPLVERLGRDFFRNLPERPGVYLMRDAGETVLYVGKAKNLRKRLGSYRVANPERMARRHLRLLRLVVRIELQECADEQAALSREAELLLALKPRFNRAGTWRGKPRFVAWRVNGDALEFSVTDTLAEDWNHFGSMGAGAPCLCAVLVRLLWLAMNRSASIEELPEGWAAGRVITPLRIRGECSPHEVHALLSGLGANDAESFCRWVDTRRAGDTIAFERTWLENEFESVREWFKPSLKRTSPTDNYGQST